MEMIASRVIMVPITSSELTAGTPRSKIIRKKTTYLSMGGDNTNRVSSIFKPRRNILTCLMMTRTIIC